MGKNDRPLVFLVVVMMMTSTLAFESNDRYVFVIGTQEKSDRQRHDDNDNEQSSLNHQL